MAKLNLEPPVQQEINTDISTNNHMTILPNDYSGQTAYNRGFAEASPRAFDINQFKLSGPNVDSNVPLDVLEESRAQAQEWWRLAGNSTVQLGGTIIGQTLTSIGSIFSFPKTIYNQIFDITKNEADPQAWDNLVNDGLSGVLYNLGRSIEDGSRNLAPIYQTKRAQEGGFGGGFGDATWWASMFPTIGSAVASMIPVVGQIRLITAGGRALSSLNGVSRIANAARTIGRFIQRPGTLQTFGALSGAHLDVMEEVVREYDTQLEYAQSLGMSEEEARNYAGTFASTAYNNAWLYGFVFNAIELNTIMKGLNKGPMSLPGVDRATRKNIYNMARQGRQFTGLDFNDASRIYDKTWKNVARSLVDKAGDYAKISLSEGIEEMRVDIALQEGEVAANRYANVYDPRTEQGFIDRIVGYIDETQSWDSFIWGAFGGLTISAGRNGLRRIANSRSNVNNSQQQYKTINDALQDTMETLINFEGDLSIKPIIEQVTNEDGNVSERVVSISDPGQNLYIPLFNTLGQANALDYGRQYLNEILNLPEDQITELYGANKREVIESILTEFDRAEEIYRKNRNVGFGTKFEDYIRNNVSSLDYMTDYYNRQFEIINTNLREQQLEYQTLEAKRNQKLRDLDSQVYNLNASVETSNEQLDTLNKANQKHKSILNDSRLNTQLNELRNQISELELTSQDITNQQNLGREQLRTLNRNYRELSNRITNTENGELRDNLIQQLNTLYDNRIETRRANRNLSNSNYRNRVRRNQLSTAISIIENQFEIEQLKIDFNNSAIQEIESERNTLLTRINQLRESRPEILSEYDRIVEEYNKPQPNNITIDNLRIIRDNLLQNLNDLLQVQNNKQEYANKLEDAIIKSETLNEQLQNLKDQRIQEEELEEQELSQEEIEDRNIAIESQIDDTGISYTLNRENSINGFTYNNRKYDIGSSVNYNGEIQTISSINIDESNNLSINLSNGEIISVSQIETINITDPIRESISDIASTFSTEQFNSGISDYIRTIKNLRKVIRSRTFKQAYINNSLDEQINLDRYNTSLGIINSIIRNRPTEFIYPNNATQEQIDKINLDNNNLIDEVLSEFRSINASSLKTYNYSRLYNSINERFEIVLLDKSAEINDTIQSEYIPKLVNNITDYISTIGQYNPNTNSITINTTYGLEEIKVKLNDILNLFKNTLSNQLYTTYDLESFRDLENELNDLFSRFVDEITQSFISTLHIILGAQSSQIESNINNIKTNKSSLSTILGDTNINNLISFTEQLLDISKKYQDRSIPPTIYEFENIKSIYQNISDLFNITEDQYISNTEDYNLLTKNGIFNLLSEVNKLYTFFDTYQQTYGDNTYNEDNILNSINVLAGLSEDIQEEFQDSTLNEYFPDPKDYRYYITPSELTAFKALDEILARQRVLNKYVPTHRLSYNDILEMIYDGPNGSTELERLFQPIWNTLINVANYDRIAQVKSQIRQNVPVENTTEIFRILDNIKNFVVSPMTSVSNGTISSRFIDGNNLIRQSYLTEFKRTHKQSEFRREIREGIIVPNNAIYEYLNNIYDPQLKQVEHETIIDGITFTAKELIEAQQSLFNGQELQKEITNNGDTINLYTIINNKRIPLGNISLTSHFTFGPLEISRLVENSSDTYIYDSAFGTSEGLSPVIQRIISSASNSQRIFDKLRDYYKVYYNARRQGLTNTPEINSQLDVIFNELGEINKGTNEKNSIYNGLIQASNYNSENEGLNIIDHSRIYQVLEPIFYNVSFENINDYLRWGTRIRQTYENLNNRLSYSFEQTEILKNQLQEDPNTIIRISHINKTGISYANTNKFRNPVKGNIQTDAELNNKPVVNIVNRQSKGTVNIVSSLTLNQRLSGDFTESTILDEDRGFQVSFEIRSNANSDGISYIPAQRGNLGYSTNTDNQYNKYAVPFVKQNIVNILSDRFLTSLSDQSSSSRNTTIFVSPTQFKNTKNRQLTDVLNDLSEAIIVDSKNDNNTIPWFNVSNLYINNPNTDQSTMTKDIEFISVIRGRRYSYGYRIRAAYEANENIDDPTSLKYIDVIRTRTNAGRIREAVSLPFTSNTLYRHLGDPFDYKTNPRGLYSIRRNSVRFYVRSQAQLAELFNNNLFNELFNNMQRGLKTTYNNDSFTFTSKANGNSFGANFNEIDGTNIIESTGVQDTNGRPIINKVFNGSYTSAVLEWAKRTQGYTGRTSFPTIQDFYLDTDALTTGAVGITDVETGEVITNYQLNGIAPRLYITADKVNLKLPSIETETSNDLTKAKNIIQSVSGNEGNFYDKLKVNNKISRKTLENLGIIPSYFTKTLSDSIIKFYNDTYNNVETFPLLYINDRQEAIDRLNLNPNITEEEYRTLRAEYNPRSNRIAIFNNLFDNANSNLQNIGNAITHETLHYRIRKDIQNGRLNENLITELRSLLSDLSNIESTNIDRSQLNETDVINLNEFLRVINDNPNTNYLELISYGLTDSTFMGILNRIEITDPITQRKESIWNKILNAIMSILGFNNVSYTSGLGQLKTIILNNVNRGRNITFVEDASQSSYTSSLPGSETDAMIEQQSNVEQSEIIEINLDEVLNLDVLDIDLDSLTDEDILSLNDDSLSSVEVNPYVPGREEVYDEIPIPPAQNIANDILISQNNSLSLKTDLNEINDFVENYTDDNNLKIC